MNGLYKSQLRSHLTSKLKTMGSSEKTPNSQGSGRHLNKNTFTEALGLTKQPKLPNNNSQSFAAEPDRKHSGKPDMLGNKQVKTTFMRSDMRQSVPNMPNGLKSPPSALRKLAKTRDSTDMNSVNMNNSGMYERSYDLDHDLGMGGGVSKVGHDHTQPEVKMLKKSRNSEALMEPVKHNLTNQTLAADRFRKTMKPKISMDNRSSMASLQNTGLFAQLEGIQKVTSPSSFRIESVFPGRSRSPSNKDLHEENSQLSSPESPSRLTKLMISRNQENKKPPQPSPEAEDNRSVFSGNRQILASPTNTMQKQKPKQANKVLSMSFFMDTLKGSKAASSQESPTLPTTQSKRDRGIFLSPKSVVGSQRLIAPRPIDSIPNLRGSLAALLPDYNKLQSTSNSKKESLNQIPEVVERVVIDMEEDELEVEERPSFRGIPSPRISDPPGTDEIQEQERVSFRSGGIVSSFTRPGRPEDEERISFKTGKSNGAKVTQKQNTKVRKAMELLDEHYQQEKLLKRAREKFADDQVNNSMLIPTHKDSMMIEGADEANKSLELCERMLDIEVNHNKKGLKSPEFYDQETKDSGEGGFNSHILLGDDSPKDEDMDSHEVEAMFEKICKAYPLAKSLSTGVKDFFAKSSSKIDSEFKTSISHYELMKCIGKGTFGKVHLGVQILTGAKVALKAITKKHLAMDDLGKKRVQMEINLLMKASKHTGVVGLLEVFESKDYFFLVTEYAARGDLEAILKKQTSIPEVEARGYFFDIVTGLDSLHKLKIVHRDIKLDNILVGEDGKARLADLGVSKQLQAGELLNDLCGTPACQSPESLKGNAYDGFLSDIWSLGVMLYHLIFGKMPFRAERVEDLYEKITMGQIMFPARPETSHALKDLICRMLQKDPARRINLNEIKTHLWLEQCGPQITVANNKPKEVLERFKHDRLASKLVQHLGFPKKYLQDSVRANAFNHATACYQALFRSLNRE